MDKNLHCEKDLCSLVQDALFSSNYNRVKQIIDEYGINLSECSENDPVLFAVNMAFDEEKLEKNIFNEDLNNNLTTFDKETHKLINNISDYEVKYVDGIYKIIMPKFPEEFLLGGYVTKPQYLGRIKDLKSFFNSNNLDKEKSVKYLGVELPNHNNHSGYYFHFFGNTRIHLSNLIRGDSRFLETIKSVEDINFRTLYNK